jgi:hydrogenase large subunit
VLRGRDPRDAAHITQRVCGICPIPHARAACEGFEQATGVTVTNQARLIRNIVQAANFIDSHLLHFYALALPDYVTGLPLVGPWPEDAPPRPRKGGDQLDAARLAEHVGTSLRIRRFCHEVIVALAGKMPHAAGIVPGGATATLNKATLEDLAALAAQVRLFVDGPYAHDAKALADAFPAFQRIGASGAALLSFGAFPERDGRLLFPGGLLPPHGGRVVRADPSGIAESSASSRYAPRPPIHPAKGSTVPALDRVDAYSWIKAPRLAGYACEVGPLARAVLSGRDPGGRGVMARHLARQAEASLLAASLETWIAQLSPGASALITFPEVPDSGAGAGLTEAPRGALGHWVTIEKARVSHYGIVSPTTWNASPRDDAGHPGPLERALEGVGIADAADPIEAVRVVHSFDPCLQCAVH